MQIIEQLHAVELFYSILRDISAKAWRTVSAVS